MQYLLVILILAGCIGYVAVRLFQRLKTPGDPCGGCEGCALQEKCSQKQKK